MMAIFLNATGAKPLGTASAVMRNFLGSWTRVELSHEISYQRVYPDQHYVTAHRHRWKLQEGGFQCRMEFVLGGEKITL